MNAKILMFVIFVEAVIYIAITFIIITIRNIYTVII